MLSPMAGLHRWRPLLFALLGASALAGCSDDQITVELMVRTDLVPAHEFDAVTVFQANEGDGGALEEIASVSASSASEDWFSGRTITEIDTAPAILSLVVQATLAGEIVVTRPIEIRAEADSTQTIVLTRSCMGAVCPTAADSPNATSCLSAECVVPRCHDGSESECALFNNLPSCEDELDCPASAPCAEARCESGVCIYEAFADRCTEDTYCDAFSGCLNVDPTMRDAGVMDGGPADGGVPGLSNETPTGTLVEGSADELVIRLRPLGAPIADTTITARVTDASELEFVGDSVATLAAESTSVVRFTVRSVDDDALDGTVSARVRFTVESGDSLWDGVAVDPTVVMVMDDDSPGLLFTPAGAAEVTEGGSAGSANVRLATQPSADVTVALSSTPSAQLTLTPATLDLHHEQLGHRPDRERRRGGRHRGGRHRHGRRERHRLQHRHQLRGAELAGELLGARRRHRRHRGERDRPHDERSG